ncbi:MAG: SAP domain-containing protein [Desulfuromonadales bacterium]|nr:SAP domain-containing protein [Desulfuromonadales bacterium]
MNMKEIKALAAQKGLRAGRLKKDELIRTIQKAENNNPCYMTNQVDQCREMTCLWRGDCG